MVKYNYDPGRIPSPVLKEAIGWVTICDYPDHFEILVSGDDGYHVFVQWYFMWILCNFHGYQSSDITITVLGYEMFQITSNKEKKIDFTKSESLIHLLIFRELICYQSCTYVLKYYPNNHDLTVVSIRCDTVRLLEFLISTIASTENEKSIHCDFLKSEQHNRQKF